jgi:hypothetical protein
MSVATNATRLRQSVRLSGNLTVKENLRLLILFVEERQVCIECDSCFICKNSVLAGISYFRRRGFLQQTKGITDGVL